VSFCPVVAATDGLEAESPVEFVARFQETEQLSHEGGRRAPVDDAVVMGQTQ
jgi:hypothetical protein